MLHDPGNLRSERHPDIHNPYSQPFCSLYKRQFPANRSLSPYLILCDLDMSVMDGMETLAEIRRDPLLKSIPLVLITAVATEAEEQSMMRNGADGILRRPFAFAALLKIVQTHLDRPKGNPTGA